MRVSKRDKKSLDNRPFFDKKEEMRLYTRKEVCEILGISLSMMGQLSSMDHDNPYYLPYVRMGNRSMRFLEKDIRDFILRNRVISRKKGNKNVEIPYLEHIEKDK